MATIGGKVEKNCQTLGETQCCAETDADGECSLLQWCSISGQEGQKNEEDSVDGGGTCSSIDLVACWQLNQCCKVKGSTCQWAMSMLQG